MVMYGIFRGTVCQAEGMATVNALRQECIW